MSDESRDGITSEAPASGQGRGALLATLVVALLLLAAGGSVTWLTLQRLDALEAEVARLSAQAAESTQLSQQASEKAFAAETAAREAALAREAAEGETAGARQLADAALQDAAAARDEAEAARERAARAEAEKARAEAEKARAEAEAARIRRQAESELNRLQQALGLIAETRRTALGVVMNLGSDHLRFAFDKAVLRPEDRELLSRIAGVLLTSQDYTISINGHTDDVGSDSYNQGLSERRAEAVRDFLVQAGLPASIFSVTGHGKTRPLVPGSSDAARAKNRRVELGIVNTRILYGKEQDPQP